jgi:hypothetical protein
LWYISWLAAQRARQAASKSFSTDKYIHNNDHLSRAVLSQPPRKRILATEGIREKSLSFPESRISADFAD